MAETPPRMVADLISEAERRGLHQFVRSRWDLSWTEFVRSLAAYAKSVEVVEGIDEIRRPDFEKTE